METKQVIVLRKDLNMRKGKMVAQGAHASMKVFFDLMAKHDDGSLVIDEDSVTDAMREWMDGAFTKVCVGVDNEQELLRVFADAKRAGLPCSLITDAGRTEFSNIPTKTAVAVGPGPSEEVDKITGLLKLL